MKRIAVVLVVALALCLSVSLAFAGDAKSGVVKSVDEKAGTVVVTIDGKDETLKADKGVDLGKVKEGKKVTVTVDGGVVKEIKEKKAAPVGC